MFRSTDEIFNFDFQDAVIDNVKFSENSIVLNVSALIVEPENSQNENFTKSYADSTKIKFFNGNITSGIKDGYKLYDANDKIVEEVPDTYLSIDEIKLILKNAKGAYLFALDANSDSTEELFSYNLSIEFPNEEEYDTTVTKSYQVGITFNKVTFEWERYLNKVQ